jgi:protein-disulfide isomerase
METTEKSKNLINISTAIIAAALIIGGAVIISRGAPTTPSGGKAPAVDSAKVNIENEPFIGDKNAPVVMAYWYDYQCPFCQRNEEASMPQLLSDYVNTGKLKIVFKDFEFLGPDSQTLGKYSRAVWETAPDKFYAWHKAIFDNQGQENTGWATAEKLRSVTESVLGMVQTDAVINLVNKNGAAYQKEMDADKVEGAALGINGTPAAIIGTKLISGAVPYDQFKAAIEAALAAQ